MGDEIPWNINATVNCTSLFSLGRFKKNLGTWNYIVASTSIRVKYVDGGDVHLQRKFDRQVFPLKLC